MSAPDNAPPAISDTELIHDVRNGSAHAYGQLYERHVDAAHRMARQVAVNRSDTDDLVSEAFSRVLATLRAGKGPDTAFRAYLLTAIRHTAYNRTHRTSREQLVDDMATVPQLDLAEIPKDLAIEKLEKSFAAQAFARLPERWRMVLWHIEIEGQSPAEVAPLLGTTSNGVSALAYRAREGLKQQYLQVHLMSLERDDARRCGPTVEKLGAWTRNSLTAREQSRVDGHLATCARCRALAAELSEVNSSLLAVVGPIVLGVTAASGYLTTATGGSAATGTLAAAGHAAGNTTRNVLIGGAAAAAVAALILALLPPDQPPAEAEPPPRQLPPAIQLAPHELLPTPAPAPKPAPTETPKPQSIETPKPPPVPDGVHVDRVIDSGWGVADNQIKFTVTNVSGKPGMAEATVTFPNGVHGGYAVPGCDYRGMNPARCYEYMHPGCDWWAYDYRHLRCRQWLNPGESFTRTIWLGAGPDSLWTDPDTSQDYIRRIAVPVSAIINEYRESTGAVARLWYPWQPFAKPVQDGKSVITTVARPPEPGQARQPGADSKPVSPELHGAVG